jgi:origin recognition complex subunit 3
LNSFSQCSADHNRWIGAKLDAGETQDARKLLDSNQYLFDSVMNHLRSGEESLNRLSTTVHLFAQIRESLQLSPSLRLSSIWIKAASADLLGSPLLRETMLSLKKVSSDKLLRLLDAIKTTFAPEACLYQRELEELTRSSSAETPLRSQYDVRNESVRTTVVAQKVLLSKHKATLSEQDKAYSDLVGRFHDAIESWFSSQFINPQDLFLSEILMYDLRSPHTEVFQPRPRFAIERALSSPHDYLGCTCCSAEGVRDGESSLASTQPATAILYQLYLESGALINVSDLWAAFNAIVGEGGEDEDSKTM